MLGYIALHFSVYNLRQCNLHMYQLSCPHLSMFVAIRAAHDCKSNNRLLVVVGYRRAP